MNIMKLQIVNLRKREGLTQQQLAEKIGVSYQTISKWENGTSLPDISMLPIISNCFNVSVDEILGLKQLESNVYEAKGTNQSSYWNKKLDYLQESRSLMWNDDYLDFLVKCVWKIDKPINVIDFGCGYGFLGIKIMPLLPVGSSYTGIDFNENLIAEAKKIFAHYKWQSNFVVSDLNSYSSSVKYDFAICQAFLRHLPNPRDLLLKMINSVEKGGMVACIEVNRNIENSGLCIKGIEFNEFEKTPVLYKLWRSEFETEGRDYCTGMKIPFYMKEFGLYNINSRMNDRINYIDSDDSSNNNFLKAFLNMAGLDKPKSVEDQEKIIELFMNRGITRFEAETFLNANESTRLYIENNRDQLEIIHTYGQVISYGWK